jgi:hypothetical protein
MTDATTNETPNIDKQVEENGELLAVAASERLARRDKPRSGGAEEFEAGAATHSPRCRRCRDSPGCP